MALTSCAVSLGVNTVIPCSTVGLALKNRSSSDNPLILATEGIGCKSRLWNETVFNLSIYVQGGLVFAVFSGFR